jgi:hypothetical protein
MVVFRRHDPHERRKTMGIKTLAAVTLATFTLAACSTTNDGKVSDASGTPTPPASGGPATNPPAAETPTWGKRYTWKDGLAIEIAAPQPCKPGEYAVATNKIERAVKFGITVINGTDKPVDSGVLSVGGDVQFNGAKADLIFDSGGECGTSDATGTVMPGKTFTYAMAYAVGPQPGEMQITFDPHFGTGDKAVFTGKA